jgi:nucleoside-diphosphate-sugar epimerase
MACKIEKNDSENSEDNISLWVNGIPMREFIFMDGLADAMLRFLKRGCTSSGKPINIGNGTEIRISAPADLNKAEVDCKEEIRRDRRKPSGSWGKLLDNSVLQNLG